MKCSPGPRQKDSIDRYVKRLGTRSVAMKEVGKCSGRCKGYIDRDALGIRR